MEEKLYNVKIYFDNKGDMTIHNVEQKHLETIKNTFNKREVLNKNFDLGNDFNKYCIDLSKAYIIDFTPVE